jgi:FAD/FMN-containing dehydrogenase
MRDIYTRAAADNFTVVGGADANVGVGGYLTGAGHSPISAKYGLSTDNVLEMELVTPEGDIIIANECQNEDLFWAMRGVSTCNSCL